MFPSLILTLRSSIQRPLHQLVTLLSPKSRIHDEFCQLFFLIGCSWTPKWHWFRNFPFGIDKPHLLVPQLWHRWLCWRNSFYLTNATQLPSRIINTQLDEKRHAAARNWTDPVPKKHCCPQTSVSQRSIWTFPQPLKKPTLRFLSQKFRTR